MSFIWSTENIRALAPDGLTFNQARGIFFGNKWLSLGGNENFVWGIYPAGPNWKFQTAVKLEEPTFYCSCRSRIRPCKHNLAILFALQRSSDSFLITNDLPDWVQAWQDKQNPQPKTPLTEEEKLIREERKEAGRDKRIEQMKLGIQDLERWLSHVMETGLAEVKEYPLSYWDDFASRMVDAKLGGIARRIRLVKEYLDMDNWPERLMNDLGDFYLLTRAFKNLDYQSPETQKDILGVAGLSIKKSEVLESKGILDDWLVLGQQTGTEEKLTYRRTWLRGIDTEKNAVLLDYTWGNQGFETHWNISQLLEGEICYYPSAFPQRALFRNFKTIKKSIPIPEGFPDFESFARAHAKAIKALPWMSGFPVLLEDVIPVHYEGEFYLVDRQNKQLKLDNALKEKTMKLLAISCGKPITIFGEWDGFSLTPLSAFTRDRLLEL